MEPIYVFGHKNPDTDTICSAIAYAYLKNTQSEGHIPARLGDLNRETKFVLGRFNVEAPLLLDHVYLRAEDVMTTQVISAPTTCTIHDVGLLMLEHDIHAVPIIDEVGRVAGVVTERTLARNYLKELHVQGLQDIPTSLGKIADTLGGQIVVGDPATTVQGKVVTGAMSPEAMIGYIDPGDLVALGNRENAQEAALRRGTSCLIITGNFAPSAAIRHLAEELGAAIIVSPHGTFTTTRLINLSVSTMQMLDSKMLMVTPNTLVRDITSDLVDSKAEIVLVNDTQGRLVGVLTKSDLVTRRQRRVILVDHSERSQSAEGIEKAEILEIVDHHRLGGLETAGPMTAIIAPVGCTATLVLRRYQEMGETPPKAMAGLMLAAILSDTMLLKSPTATPEDAKAIETLGQILGEDPMAFGREMYNAKFDIATLSPEGIVTNDLKAFELGKMRVGVGQIEVADKEPVLARKADILVAMADYQDKYKFDLILLMVSDILLEGSELLAVGHTRLVEKAFGVSLTEQAVFLPGVLSRKKQVIPPLSNAV